MQYVQRKLQRSVTEIRRSRSGRPNVSFASTRETVAPMSDNEPETDGYDRIDESGRNPTQQRMDEEGVENVPVDAEWGTGDGPGPRQPPGSERLAEAGAGDE